MLQEHYVPVQCQKQYLQDVHCFLWDVLTGRKLARSKHMSDDTLWILVYCTNQSELAAWWSGKLMHRNWRKSLSAAESFLPALIKDLHLKHPSDHVQVSEGAQRPHWRSTTWNVLSDVHIWTSNTVSRIIKLWRENSEKDICPQFCNSLDLDFKCTRGVWHCVWLNRYSGLVEQATTDDLLKISI